MRWDEQRCDLCVGNVIHLRHFRQNPAHPHVMRCNVYSITWTSRLGHSAKYASIHYRVAKHALKPKAQLLFTDFQNCISQCTYLIQKSRDESFPIASSIFLQLHVDCHFICTLRPLRCYRLMIIPTPLIKCRDVYSAIHALRRSLCTYALKTLQYLRTAFY